MSAALDAIHSEVGTENCVDSCSRDGCDVDLTDVPPARVIVDADKAFPAHGGEGSRCDFILFMDRDDESLLAVPLELKSGRAKVSEAIKQLRGGANFAACFASSPDTDFVPVLIHEKGLDRKDRLRLKRKTIAFHGRKRTIKTARCGRPRNLADALSE